LQDEASIDSNRLVESPIIRDPTGHYVELTQGADPGPDRVVFDGQTGTFAGVFTHRDGSNNRFHRALGHNEDVNSPEIDEGTLISTVMDNYLAGLPEFGSMDLPLKRAPTFPDANFQINRDDCPSSNGQCYCYNTITNLGWFPRDAGIQVIDYACELMNEQTVPPPNGQAPQVLSQTLNAVVDNTKYWVEVAVWTTQLQGGQPSVVNRQSCIDSLTAAMDNCQTGTGTQKIGGQYILYIDGVGSQQFLIHPAANNPAPPAPSQNNEAFDV